MEATHLHYVQFILWAVIDLTELLVLLYKQLYGLANETSGIVLSSIQAAYKQNTV